LSSLQFVVIQTLLVTAAVAWGASRYGELMGEQALPPLRAEPLTVEPLYDYPTVVTDEQLARVLNKLRPRFHGSQTKINHVDHALRFWTTSAEFADEQFLDGQAMRALLVDHRRFAEVYGASEPPLLIDTPTGVDVREQHGNRTSSHVDHTMACLAEVGTPLDYPIFTAGGQTTFGALVEDSLRSFRLNQPEYEWSALTYALLLPPVTHWTTTDGQQVSFDRLARRIMREDLGRGVCFANHRMHTLAMFLRVDEQVPILSSEVRAEVMEYLKRITVKLVAHQHADGFWDGNWPFSRAGQQAAKSSGNELADRILATGHALEWWALAPEQLHPPRHVLASAGQWLVRTIDQLSDQQVQNTYTYLTHAGRALALWRGQSPAEAWSRAVHGEIGNQQQ
jgi:hypothetical protein